MITIIPLWLMVFLYAYQLKIIKRLSFIFNVWAALFVCALGFLEVTLLQPDHLFINPDEFWYSLQSQKPIYDILNDHSRYLSYILFSHITYISAGEWAFRIQSVPFAVLMSLILYDATGKKNILWLFPLFFGYFFFLATLNMRDSMIICAMLFFALKASRSKIKGIIFWSFIAIMFFSIIRPEFSVLWLCLLIWLLVDQLFRKKFFITFAMPSMAVFAVFIFMETPILETPILAAADYLYPGRVEEALSDSAEELGKLPFLNANASALVRQLITPLPLSKLIMLLTYGRTNNLVLIELSRIVLMTVFYFMVLALLLKPMKSYRLLKESSFSKILFAISVLTLVMYALYNDGGGDTRNKVYPFIFTYVMFTNLYIFRISSGCISNGLHAKQSEQDAL